MTVLITGGLGFIGTHVVREFLDHGEQVVATRFGGEQIASILDPFVGKTLTVEPLDIASPHSVIDVCRRNNIESIVHLAGPAIGQVSPIEEYRINTTGLLNIMEAGRIVGVRRISFASSINIYFGLPGPYVEDVKVGLVPVHPIETFKKAEELMGQYLARVSNMDLVALRLGNIYGPLYRTRRHWPAQLVHAAVNKCSAPLDVPGIPPFYRDDHSSDMCYVKDCARGVRLVHNSTKLTQKSYNIGGGQDVTFQRFSDVAKALFPDLEIHMEDGVGPNNVPNGILDLTRVTADAGYKPEYTIEAAMDAYASWLRAGNPF